MGLLIYRFLQMSRRNTQMDQWELYLTFCAAYTYFYLSDGWLFIMFCMDEFYLDDCCDIWWHMDIQPTHYQIKQFWNYFTFLEQGLIRLCKRYYRAVGIGNRNVTILVDICHVYTTYPCTIIAFCDETCHSVANITKCRMSVKIRVL